jgi:hypothetical protein
MEASKLVEYISANRPNGRPNVYVDIKDIGLVQLDPDELYVVVNSLIEMSWIDCRWDEGDLIINGGV